MTQQTLLTVLQNWPCLDFYYFETEIAQCKSALYNMYILFQHWHKSAAFAQQQTTINCSSGIIEIVIEMTSNTDPDFTDTGSYKVNGSNYLKLQQAQVIKNNIHGISQLLNTGLNAECLDTCIKLIEAGVHPQALAEVITQIRREVSAINNDENE